MGMRDPSRFSRLEETVTAGQAALEGSRFEEAASYFKAALRLGSRNADEESLIRCDLSEALGKRGLGKEQLEAVAKYDIPSELNRLTEAAQMKVLIRLGWAHSLNNDVPRSIGLFNQAMRLARALDDDAGMGACDYGLGRAYRNLNEIRIARDHYTAALEHYRKIGNWRDLAESYINIGYINAFEGHHRNALHALKQALAIIGDRNEFDLRGRAYMYLAITYDNLGDANRALPSWEICIDSFHKAGNALYVGINENNLAVKLLWLGQWERAEQLAAGAIEKLRKTTGVASLGGILDTLAQIQVLRGNLDRADDLLQESLQVLSSVNVGEWAEVSTRATMARSSLAKGDANSAIAHLERAIDICLRSGTHYVLSEVRLWMADALLAKGSVDGAREIVNALRPELREGPNLIVWGFLMRMVARIEAADGHLAAAIQSLGQSSSIFEIRGNVYAVAINQVLLASMLEQQGRIREAVELVKSALTTFKRLGAELDASKATAYLPLLEEKRANLTALKSRKAATLPDSADLDLVSAIDGFIARRLVQASISRELLLYELASVVRDRAMARAVLIVEMGPDGPKVEVGLGLNEVEKARQAESLSRIPSQEHSKYLVYSFSDNVQSNFLLQVLEPGARRFVCGMINMQPLLYLAEQGLESQILRTRNRRTQVFDPSQVLSQAELPGFICASRAMSRVLEQVHKIRSSDVTV
ncbi:MAG TPA: tetratricopeptide repeat protein, partial [Blastocatellia bacterium]|nr:tetratricopeptide repeat protein [Blastocatellia bacterium]